MEQKGKAKKADKRVHDRSGLDTVLRTTELPTKKEWTRHDFLHDTEQ